MAQKKIITICASVSFYKDIPAIEKQLKALRFQVKLPESLYTMIQTKNFNTESYKPWFQDPSYYKRKTQYIKRHNKKIAESNAILVLNNEKKGVKGYIGGNVLMEMAVAFHLKKRIYIYNQIDEKSPLKEEILGVQPIIIDQDLTKIT